MGVAKIFSWRIIFLVKRIVAKMISFETYLEDLTFKDFVIKGMNLDHYCGDSDWPYLAMEPIHRVPSLEDPIPTTTLKKEEPKKDKRVLMDLKDLNANCKEVIVEPR